MRDIIAFLRLIYNPMDEVSLSRVINLPPRGIGEKTVANLAEISNRSGLNMGEVLLDLIHPASPALLELGRNGEKLARFGRLLSQWRALAQSDSLSNLFDRARADTEYEAYIRDKSEEGQDRWENVLELRAVAMEYETRGLQEFLEAMALVADQDTLPETLDAPTMLTLHAAKGLEFERVYIVGLDEMYCRTAARVTMRKIWRRSGVCFMSVSRARSVN